MKVIEVQDNDHSPLGPSAAKRWINCPASVAATKDVPDEQTEFAASGTASHTLSEWCRVRGVRAEEFRGTILKVGRFDCVVDNDRIASVNTFCDYMTDLGGDQFCEVRVSYEPWVKNGFGTSDGIAVVGSTCHIVDFKDGSGVVVDAEGNEQLLLYALGFYHDFGWLYDIREFVLHIVQPRVNHYAKSKPVALEEVIAWAANVVGPGAVWTEAPDAPFSPGEWCSNNFCRIRKTCRARAEHIMKSVVGDFEDLNAATKSSARALPTLSNDEVANVLHMLPQITKWASEIKSHAISEIGQGRTVGDWKLVNGRTTRGFAKPADVVVTEVLDYARENGIEIEDDDLYTEPELLSMPAIEKLVGAKAFKEATDKRPAGPLTHLVTKSPGKPALAPGSDSRPSMSVDALKEFENLDANEE